MKKADYSSTRAKLINVTIPEETRTYKPIEHERLMDLTLNSIQAAGLSLNREIYYQGKDGNVGMGRYIINGIEDDDMQLQILWQNSYDKSLRVSFSISTLIKVCSNGMCKSHGLGTFKKKHQGEVQSFTPAAITEYIRSSGDIFEEMKKEKEIMKNVELDKRAQAEILGRAYIEHEFIKSVQLNVIKNELVHPTHNYGDPMSLFSLYQYTTFAMRDVSPSLYLQDHIDAHEFFSGYANISHEEIKPATIIRDDPRFIQLSLFEINQQL